MNLAAGEEAASINEEVGMEHLGKIAATAVCTLIGKDYE